MVLCQRGTISFYDKVHNVQLSGGTAAVLYNNVSGNFLGTLGDGYTSTIPAISLSMEDGQWLVANKLGVNGLAHSTITWNTSAYEYYDGTSMATPHVSAVAALLWSWNPSLTNAQIRTAMNSTALDLGTAGRDNYYGNGLVQAYNAWVYLGGSHATPTATATATSTATATATATATRQPQRLQPKLTPQPPHRPRPQPRPLLRRQPPLRPRLPRRRRLRRQPRP